MMMKHYHKEFPSDVYVTFKALSVMVNVMSDKSTTTLMSLDEFFATDMNEKLILSFELPKYSRAEYVFHSYKVSFIFIFQEIKYIKYIKINYCRSCHGLKMRTRTLMQRFY